MFISIVSFTYTNKSERVKKLKLELNGKWASEGRSKS